MTAEPTDQLELSLQETGQQYSKFSIKEFRKLLGPGVYVVYSKEEFLYIGSSKNISGRMSNSNHARLREALAREDSNVITIFARSEKHARAIESELIADLQPIFNCVGKSRNASASRKIAERDYREPPVDFSRRTRAKLNNFYILDE